MSLDEENEACINSLQTLLVEHYDTFIDIVKHSQIGNTHQNEESFLQFEQNYINTSIFKTTTKPVRPVYLNDQLTMIPFCEIAPKLSLSNISLMEPAKCKLFDPFPAQSGLCYTFNSKALPEIFKPSPIVSSWKKFLNVKEKSGEFCFGHHLQTVAQRAVWESKHH